jgi:REP-associated tyrosine transposase
MNPNAAGEMSGLWWKRVAERFPTIENDLFVVMPNHFHGILVIRDEDSELSIIDAIQWFKSITTRKYGDGVKEQNWTRYNGHLWQRSFHDHIIRDEISLNKLREYILYNPALWEKDKFYEA